MLTQIEVSNFTLEYDGIFHISFEGVQRMKVYLPIYKLFLMFQKEGYDFEDAINFRGYDCKIPFKKVVLLFDAFQDEDGKVSYLTSEASEDYLDKRLTFFEFKIKE